MAPGLRGDLSPTVSQPTSSRRSGGRLAGLGRLTLLILLLAWFGLGASYLVLRHYLWPRVDAWRPELVERLSRELGRPVDIGHIETGFDGLLPRITFTEVSMRDADGAQAASAAAVTAVVSPRTLLSGEFRLALLRIQQPVVRIERMAPRVLRIAGFEVDLNASPDPAVLDRLLRHRRVVLTDAVVDWADSVRGVARRFEGVEFAAASTGRRHRVSMRAPAAEGLWQRLELAADLERPTGFGPPQPLRGEGYAGIEGLDLAGARSVLPLTDRMPKTGEGDVRLWLDFAEGRVRSAQTKILASELRWAESAGGWRASSVDLEATLEPGERALEVRLQRLAAKFPGGLALSGVGEQTLRIDADGTPVSGRVALGPFDAAAALAYARTLPARSRPGQALDGVEVSGGVSSLAARWTLEPGADATQGPATYEVALDFEALALKRAAGANWPWFQGLSGQARVTPDGGELRLRDGPATLGFPGIFADPVIALDSLAGEARWARDRRTAGAPLRLEIAELRFANPDAQGTVRGSYRSGGKGAGIVDMTGKLGRADASRVVRYLPQEIPQTVRDWIGGAVTAGRSDDVRFTLRGDLADFPFRRPQDGDFSVDAQLRDTTLRYAPGWPAIERFEGDLAFRRGGMRVGMRSGRVFDVALSRTEALLEDFRQPVLRIQGAGEGPASDMIRFVNQSPVATRIDDFTRDATARGHAHLALRLDLPLADLAAARVAGSVEFQGNELRLDTTVPPLTAVTGALEFTDRGLALRRISAMLLGGPIRVDGETPEPGRFSIRAEGSVPAEGIRAAVDNPLTRALSGQAAYRASIEVRRRASSVVLESDLRGLAAALPKPFDKPAGAAWPLRVAVTAAPSADVNARPTRDAIRVTLRDDVRLAIERERDPRLGRLLIRRAALALQDEPVLPDSGLALQVRAPHADFDAWLALLGGGLRDAGQPATDGFAEGFSLLPSRVSVVAERMRVAGKDLNQVVFGATRAGDLWRATIASREIAGQFSWRDALPGNRTGTLTARFKRLEIPRSRAGEVESILDTPPGDLPALDIAAEELVLFDRKLGSLFLKATNSPGAGRPVWTLEELRIVNPSGKLSAKGEWAPLADRSARATRLDYDLEIIESGGLLEIYGLKDAMRGAPGHLTGRLSWRGSPLALDYPSLEGEIGVRLGRGQFLRTDPGIAKLIGVLNLQSIPRRLTLDFRDIFAGGFAFDEIEGGVAIHNGIARSDDLVMRGNQARVRIRGSADIAAETQSLAVEVRPELNAGLASIAYGAMVNPLIGLGSFVAQLALSSPIRQMFTYEFEVSGSWADPQVVERRRLPSTTPTPANGAP
jgi:uncharacterized protein (TIGR02099 family)